MQNQQRRLRFGERRKSRSLQNTVSPPRSPAGLLLCHHQGREGEERERERPWPYFRPKRKNNCCLPVAWRRRSGQRERKKKRTFALSIFLLLSFPRTDHSGKHLAGKKGSRATAVRILRPSPPPPKKRWLWYVRTLWDSFSSFFRPPPRPLLPTLVNDHFPVTTPLSGIVFPPNHPPPLGSARDSLSETGKKFRNISASSGK